MGRMSSGRFALIRDRSTAEIQRAIFLALPRAKHPLQGASSGAFRCEVLCLVHVNAPASMKNRKRLAAGLLIFVVFPAASAGYYFGYNVGTVKVLVTGPEVPGFSSLTLTFSQAELKSAGALTMSLWSPFGLSTDTLDITKLKDTGPAEIGAGKFTAGKYAQVRLGIVSAIGHLVGGGIAKVEVIPGALDAPLDIRAQGALTLTFRLVVSQSGSDFYLDTTLAGIDEG